MESKLKELGIPYIYMGDYLEESPLGKAEWMVVAGEVAGRRKEAREAFGDIPERYDAVKKRLQSAAEPAEPAKAILNSPYGGAWYVPDENSYMVRLLKDAGAEPMAVSSRGGTTIDMEEAYQKASDADYWLNVGSGIGSIEELKSRLPKFSGVKAVKDGKVYDSTLLSTPGGGNDFYESGVLNPDLVLRDMIKIFHPELVDEPFIYYKKLE